VDIHHLHPCDIEGGEVCRHSPEIPVWERNIDLWRHLNISTTMFGKYGLDCIIHIGIGEPDLGCSEVFHCDLILGRIHGSTGL